MLKRIGTNSLSRLCLPGSRRPHHCCRPNRDLRQTKNAVIGPAWQFQRKNYFATPTQLFHSMSSFAPASANAKSTPSTSVDDMLSEPSIQRFNKDHASTSLVEIQKCDAKGWGLYAKDDIQEGTVVFRARALEYLYDNGKDNNRDVQRSSHSVQTGWNRHVIMDLPAILVNHSCNANVGIQENDLGAYDFVALRDIKRGEEALWDYETSEYTIQSQFQCSCGAENCRGMLQGFHANGKLVEELYGQEFIAPYLYQDPSSKD